MKLFASGFLMGVMCSTVVLLGRAEEKYKHGIDQGRIAGLGFAARKLLKEFGEYDKPRDGQYTALFSIKTMEVVAIQVDGVKTVRVIP